MGLLLPMVVRQDVCCSSTRGSRWVCNYQWLYAKMCAVPLPEVLGGSVTIPGVPVPHFRKYGFVDFPVYSTYQTCSVVIENFSVGFPLYH